MSSFFIFTIPELPRAIKPRSMEGSFSLKFYRLPSQPMTTDLLLFDLNKVGSYNLEGKKARFCICNTTYSAHTWGQAAPALAVIRPFRNPTSDTKCYRTMTVLNLNRSFRQLYLRTRFDNNTRQTSQTRSARHSRPLALARSNCPLCLPHPPALKQSTSVSMATISLCVNGLN